MRNFGQHNATVCGFRYAKGKFVLTLDEDLQNPPEEIANLIEVMRDKGADVVYGIPMQRKHNWRRRLCSRAIMLVPRKVMRISFDISAFRLIRAEVLGEVIKSVRHDVIIDIYLVWVTNRITAARVRHEAGSGRESSYSFLKLSQVLLNLIFNYTVFPLRVSVLLGVALSVLSFAAAAYYLLQKILNQTDVPGFTAIIVSIFFSTGLILLAVGAASEYLARTFLHINRKPQSVVRQTTASRHETV
jgi:undecaprenyl-phosphate 4-deoxy-4-formamido-L-arabinose transferase